MAAHNEGGNSVPTHESPHMTKLIATIFLAVLAVGSIYGCVVNDGHRGDGRRGDHDNYQGPGNGPRDHMDRDNHRDNNKGPGDRDHH